MSARIVVDPRHLPMRMPGQLSVVLWLLFDRIGAPGWVWGATGVLLAFLWTCWVVDVLGRQERNPFHSQFGGRL